MDVTFDEAQGLAARLSDIGPIFGKDSLWAALDRAEFHTPDDGSVTQIGMRSERSIALGGEWLFDFKP